jgi:uncharacterized membrane protein YkvA (DUF1232 family)
MMRQPTATAVRGGNHLFGAGMVGQLRLAWRLLRDRRVSGAKYLLLALLALYVVSPIGAIPDFLVGRRLDDMVMAIGLIGLTVHWLPKLAPAEVVAEHVRALQGLSAISSEPPVGQPIDVPFTVR